MRCKIAELITEVPEAGGLAPRCKDYLYRGKDEVDIVINAEQFRMQKYPPNVTEKTVIYNESGYQFAMKVLEYDGFYLHASAVELDGRAYLFSGPCGMGKSTHTRIWKELFGEAVNNINDDKPVLRRLNGIWYAYGTPWCGKDGINQNRKVPLAGVCFLKQAQENRISRLNQKEALQRILTQTIRRFSDVKTMDLMLGHLDKFVREIPVFELENRPEPDAAKLSYETMCREAEGMGL